ncbi:MAG: F0F1 ATP synthase subunit B [Saprospiraceae bacterium]|nr:F0F1 ATP synthase subunit B [Saprospiraceae bacterium]
MIALLSFTPFQPTPGLAIWSLLIFLLFWFIMGKFAFTPIAKALEQRESDIQHALDAAKSAKEEMATLKAQNERILAEAREEKAKILQEAKEIKNQTIAEAKEKAKEEASKIISASRNEIENQKKAAIAEIKNQVGGMAIDIAEKLVRKQLAGNAENEAYVKSLVDEFNLN